jgi:nitrite reductase (NO-forming) / hydroxylamine reductase
VKTGLKLGMVTLVILIVFTLTYPRYIWSDEGKSNENKELYAKGKELFQSKGCVGCHTIGKGKLTGPDLKGVTQRRSEEWLKKWIKSPDTMVFTDPTAKELLKQYLTPMPNLGLNDEEVNALISYLKHEDSKDSKKGN